MSNSLDPDLEWRSVGPETGPNCLLIRLSIGNKSCQLALFCSSPLHNHMDRWNHSENTVNSKIFARILFSLTVLKDIFAK